MKKKVKITLEEWDYTCADGCCYEYGLTTKVNGEQLECNNTDVHTVLKHVLEHLGFDVEIENIFDGEEF